MWERFSLAAMRRPDEATAHRLRRDRQHRARANLWRERSVLAMMKTAGILLALVFTGLWLLPH